MKDIKITKFLHTFVSRNNVLFISVSIEKKLFAIDELHARCLLAD